MEKKRIDYLDIAKGIAIICVIIGHFFISHLNRVIYTFHIPVFFIISGFLLKPINNKEFLKKKKVTLLLPYLLTSLAICILFFLKAIIQTVFLKENISLVQELLNFIIRPLYGSGLEKTFLGIKMPYIGAIWFLLALFLGEFIVNNLCEKKHGWLYILIISLIGYYTSKYIWLPLSIQAGMLSSIFIYFGYLLKKYDIINIISNGKNKFIIIILFLIWLLGIIQHVKVDLCINYMNLGYLTIIYLCISSLCIIYISKFLSILKNTKIYNSLLLAGRYSLAIMCLHLIELDFIPYHFIYDDITNFYLKVCILISCFIFKLIIITLGIKLLKKNKTIAKLYGFKEM